MLTDLRPPWPQAAQLWHPTGVVSTEKSLRGSKYVCLLEHWSFPTSPVTLASTQTAFCNISLWKAANTAKNKQPALWTAGKLELSNTTVKVHNKMLKLSYNTVLWVLKRPKVCIWQYLLASVVVDSKNGPNAPPFLCDVTLPHLRIECVSLTPSSGLAL